MDPINLAPPATQLGPDAWHRYLRGIEYPIAKENVINIAREHGAPEEMIAMIERMPNIAFTDPDELQRYFEQQNMLEPLQDATAE